MIEYTRHEGLVNMDLVKHVRVGLIGAGSVGSFTALTLTKLGVADLTVYDDDWVSPHNIPNQFYGEQHLNTFKVDALAAVINQFNSIQIKRKPDKFVAGTPLCPITIVATDSMSSRQLVWDEFYKQSIAQVLIEARMGAEQGSVYLIRKVNGVISNEMKNLYGAMLYSDQEVEPVPCTARTIIYNVLMLASIICRAYKAVIMKEEFPWETIMDLRSMQLFTSNEAKTAPSVS